jgi:hypothetical protein
LHLTDRDDIPVDCTSVLYEGSSAVKEPLSSYFDENIAFHDDILQPSPVEPHVDVGLKALSFMDTTKPKEHSHHQESDLEFTSEPSSPSDLLVGEPNGWVMPPSDSVLPSEGETLHHHKSVGPELASEPSMPANPIKTQPDILPLPASDERLQPATFSTEGSSSSKRMQPQSDSSWFPALKADPVLQDSQIASSIPLDKGQIMPVSTQTLAEVSHPTTNDLDFPSVISSVESWSCAETEIETEHVPVTYPSDDQEPHILKEEDFVLQTESWHNTNLGSKKTYLDQTLGIPPLEINDLPIDERGTNISQDLACLYQDYIDGLSVLSTAAASSRANDTSPESAENEETTEHRMNLERSDDFEQDQALYSAGSDPVRLPVSDVDQPEEMEHVYAMSKTQIQLAVEEGKFWEGWIMTAAPSISPPSIDPESITSTGVSTVITTHATSLRDKSMSLSRIYSRSAKPPTADTYAESKEILQLLGVPVIAADDPRLGTFEEPPEAEALASSLVSCGVADYVASEDTDVLVYAASPLVRGITSKNEMMTVMDPSEIMNAMGFVANSETSEDERKKMWVDWALLLGTDFSLRIRNVGPRRALDFLRKWRSIEGVLKGFEQASEASVDSENLAVTHSETPSKGTKTRRRNKPLRNPYARFTTPIPVLSYLAQIRAARVIFSSLPPLPSRDVLSKMCQRGVPDESGIDTALRKFKLWSELKNRGLEDGYERENMVWVDDGGTEWPEWMLPDADAYE